jgi:deoxycytidine triphosphate deaminase
MILVREEIEAKGIIHDSQRDGKRSTTYDATVGKIIMEGKTIEDATFILPPRGIVWVISKEEFALPNNVTGLATLRTTWAHQGIFALNVGVVDPGWCGHLATAVVNFSNSYFDIRKGDAFIRVMFLSHNEISVESNIIASSTYLARIKTRSRLFSSTFLAMDNLVVDVAEKVLGFPRWAARLGAVAIFISAVAIIFPVAWTIASQNYVMPSRVDALEKAVSALQSHQ